MTPELNATWIGVFVLAVFPGLISTTVYRLIMPARAVEWGTAVVQGLFYSTVNFVLGLPLLYGLVFGYDPLKHSARYMLARPRTSARSTVGLAICACRDLQVEGGGEANPDSV